MENIVWKSIKDELPPIGKKILITTPIGGLAVMTLGYNWCYEEDLNRGHGHFVGTEDTIKCVEGYWMLIPERPVVVR